MEDLGVLSKGVVEIFIIRKIIHELKGNKLSLC